MVNPVLLQVLANDFKRRGISLEDGRVPDFTQLSIVPDANNGLAFRLNEIANQENMPYLKDFDCRKK